MMASASNSALIALFVTQKRSSVASPKRSSESMMKPVEEVSSASASSVASCQRRSR